MSPRKHYVCPLVWFWNVFILLFWFICLHFSLFVLSLPFLTWSFLSRPFTIHSLTSFSFFSILHRSPCLLYLDIIFSFFSVLPTHFLFNFVLSTFLCPFEFFPLLHRPVPSLSHSCVCSQKELKSTNESLKLLQKELEKAYEQGGHAGANLHTNSTLMAILETKDARISTLEKEVDLLEKELARIRDFSHYPIGGGGFGISSALSGGGGHFDFGLDRPNSPPVHDFSFTTSLGGFNFDQYRKQVSAFPLMSSFSVIWDLCLLSSTVLFFCNGLVFD